MTKMDWDRVRDENKAARSRDVVPEKTLGAQEACWCGEPKTHGWPGRELGIPHPGEEGEDKVDTTYVLTLGKFADASSADIRPLMKRAQDKVDWASEFTWEPDAHMKDRLRMKYVNSRSNKWNVTDFYITTVPVLG